ncbi:MULTISPECIES: bifunctional diguanylate cyclase/phosphodiesterase [Chromobacterium]|uniref:putative bifunctional diguanylate cyclase/phosphodiesterase n=1 Tax=Chromobacterium TaxID=535 RepID=UPI000D31C394|nr:MULTISPECIES: EAL domain-containing protein [Chromobacterium]MCP1290648.1 EAL domain-containing protein [Chromobacterium sp. S0633]PTU65551.1 PAS domain S-box protein [Chromobacterium sp. Panama]UJB30367.1 EAL domain-containing protein [Chromobacterium sp. Beijing]
MRSNTANRQLLFVVLPFLLIVVMQVALSAFSLYVVSTARAYVAGEGLWSKAQKDSIYHLTRYAQTGSDHDFQRYRLAISIQLGDHRARLALDRKPPDLDTARQGFLDGGNHPDDIENIIRAYLWFHHVSYLAEAIRYWKIGDYYLQEIQTIGEQLRQGYADGSLSQDDKAALTSQIAEINEAVKAPAQGFSRVLGNASREVSQAVWRVNLLVGLLLVLLTILQIRRLIQASDNYKAALQAEQQRAEITLQSIGDAVITLNMQGAVIYLNHSAKRMLSHLETESLGLHFDELLSLIKQGQDKDSTLSFAELCRLDESSRTYPKLNMLRHNAIPLQVSLVAAPIRDRRGEQYGIVLVLHDNTAEQQYINELSWQASHDALTGLLNRREFETRAIKAIKQLGQAEASLALMFIDLDQFKLINDTYGHAAGDELLCQISRSVARRLRASDTLARLGGDEFGVLLGNSSVESAIAKANNLRQAIMECSFQWEGNQFSISASIGLVCVSDADTSLAEVMRSADIACYMAKEKGRNRIQLHIPHNSEVSARFHEMDWVQRLRQALRDDSFTLYAQDIVPLAAHPERGRYVEVLLRLNADDGSQVPPGLFVPIAERYGLMTEIDRIVVEKVFQELALLRRAGNQDIRHCAINLSGSTLCDDGFLAFVQQQFQRSGVPPELICFEITETNAIANLEAAQRLIHELRRIGCLFSLDDFGTGMSSFAYLKHLPVDFLKIDGSFVREMATDPIDHAMVEMINHIGHVTGKRTIAEFVDTPEIVAELRKLGVDYAQGFHLSRPEPFGFRHAHGDRRMRQQ